MKTETDNEFCSICNAFYANAACEGMCSVCYKDQGNEINKPKIILEELIETIVETTLESVKKPVEETKIEEEPLPKQEAKKNDLKKCTNCSKKTGIYGHKCKCTYNFCTKCRLPENHECDFDFRKHDKEVLAKRLGTAQDLRVARMD